MDPKKRTLDLAEKVWMYFLLNNILTECTCSDRTCEKLTNQTHVLLDICNIPEYAHLGTYSYSHQAFVGLLFFLWTVYIFFSGFALCCVYDRDLIEDIV